MLIPSVREILVIHADRVGVELLRRQDDGGWPDEFTIPAGAAFTLTSIDLVVSVGELYRRSGLDQTG